MFMRSGFPWRPGKPVRALCAREHQASIRDSVHRILKDQISRLGVGKDFVITDHEIRSRLGSEAVFRGLHFNPEGIKSFEGADITWIEEGQSISQDSLDILLPTIFRNPHSELWVTWNTGVSDDPIHRFLVSFPPPGAKVAKTTWRDNPKFPSALDEQRRHMLSVCEQIGDMSAYNHVWEGDELAVSDAVVFGKRTVVEAFVAPLGARFFHGADWGFANDPTALIRCYMATADNEALREGRPRPDGDLTDLYVDREVYGTGVEIDELPQMFDGLVPEDRGYLRGARRQRWPIKADNARPEVISYMARAGFNIEPAKKWQGSLEDGIAFLRGFRRIHIHDRCVNLTQESKLYRFKVDPRTNDVLPIVVDAFNHGWDALRYSLDGYITASGGVVVGPDVREHMRRRAEMRAMARR